MTPSTGRRVVVYYAWSRPGEIGAPLAVIENRFPALFELRRILYPRLEALSDPDRFEQGVGGFLDHIMKQNFVAFLQLARAQAGAEVLEGERVTDDGHQTPLDLLLDDADTLIVISFDEFRTDQRPGPAEEAAVRRFLAHPDHLAFICPHHDIGDVQDRPHDETLDRRTAEFLHHGDRAIPPQQRFGGFGRTLLAALGLPVENCFGLRPAARPDGSPAPIEVAPGLDRLGLLRGVESFNLHPHLPHFARLGDAAMRMEVLARQPIDLAAPPHPFTASGRTAFDALLQSAPGVFAGTLLVGDATLWSSTAGGVENLMRFWTNVLQRPRRAEASHG